MRYWLIKSEPDVYGIDDLAHTETTMVGDLCNVYWLKEYMA